MEEGIVGIRQVPATQPVSIIPISVCLGRTCCCYQLKHRCCIHLQYYSCDEYHIRKTLWYTQWLKKCKPLHFCRKKLLNTIFLHLQRTDYTFFAWKIGAFQVKSGAQGIQNFFYTIHSLRQPADWTVLGLIPGMQTESQSQLQVRVASSCQRDSGAGK